MHQMFKASLMLLGFAFLLVNGEEAQTDLTQGEFRDKVHLWADHKRTQKEIGEHLKWAPQRQDWPSLPAHDKGYWRELSAAVISLLQLPSTWIEYAIFVLPYGVPAQKAQCFLQESCHPYVKTSSGGPNAMPEGQAFDASGTDTAYVLMNLFPLSDNRITVNVTFDFDKACWRSDTSCPLYVNALQAAFRHPDVEERLVKDRWDAVIFKDADDKNPYKLMAIIEMLTGLKTELGFKKDIVSEDAMGTWLGKLVVSSSADDHRTVQPPLFAFNTDEGLRPLLSNGDGTYVVKDCRALSESITTDENADPQGLNVQWSARKLYDSTTWFVRMNPSQALFAFANSASGVSKITGVDMKPFHDYWTE